jgi:3-oxoacyl-[acyl-carrier protein] reductase
MDLRLTNRIALVTGASRGIGRVTAKLLSEEGCRLAIVARRKHLLEGSAAELEKSGAERPLVLVEDIASDGAAARIRSRVLETFASLDILINNAGGSRPLDGLGSEQEWEEAMRLNFSAGRALAHAFLGAMQAQKFGRIINLTGTIEPIAMNAAIPPDGAVHIWAKALSRIVGRHGVTVNCVSPGIVHSEQIDERVFPTVESQREWADNNIPTGYIGEAGDAALVADFLSSPRARYINGEVITSMAARNDFHSNPRISPPNPG